MEGLGPLNEVMWQDETVFWRADLCSRLVTLLYTRPSVGFGTLSAPRLLWILSVHLHPFGLSSVSATIFHF